MIGLSKDYLDEPNMYLSTSKSQADELYFTEVRNYWDVCNVLNNVEPDFVCHLAAQPIV